VRSHSIRISTNKMLVPPSNFSHTKSLVSHCKQIARSWIIYCLRTSSTKVFSWQIYILPIYTVFRQSLLAIRFASTNTAQASHLSSRNYALDRQSGNLFIVWYRGFKDDQIDYKHGKMTKCISFNLFYGYIANDLKNVFRNCGFARSSRRTVLSNIRSAPAKD
jgi:hypothetical protein